MKPVCLLDLQYTLASSFNGSRYGKPKEEVLPTEKYRAWIPMTLEAHDFEVVIITARDESWKNETMARIQSELSWQPVEAFFRHTRSMKAPGFKKHILDTVIYPRYGLDKARFLALESNPATQEMYVSEGIRAIPEHVWKRQMGAAVVYPDALVIEGQEELF